MYTEQDYQDIRGQIARRSAALGVPALLMLAGVTDDAICEDYAQTEIYMEPVLVQLCAQNPALNFDALVARKENMQAFLIAFREKWGSAEEYLRYLGLHPGQVNRWKAKMTKQGE